MNRNIEYSKDGSRIINFMVPTQVKWYDYDYDESDSFAGDYENAGGWAYGIAYNDYIICACCGGVIPIEEIYEFAPSELLDPIRPLEYWVDFGESISD